MFLAHGYGAHTGHDLHGLIWEWVGDFDLSLGGETGGAGEDKFCGVAAKSALDRGDYPAFLRFGLRSSLKADYTIHTLGFRCALSVP